MLSALLRKVKMGLLLISNLTSIHQIIGMHKIYHRSKLFAEPSIAFRIRIFFIADEYRIHSRDFIKPIFSLMRYSNYCLMFIPTNSPFLPLAPYFTRVPSTYPVKDRYVLYICHRYSVVDVPLSIRQFSSDDYPLLENFSESLKNRNEILEKCNDKPCICAYCK